MSAPKRILSEAAADRLIKRAELACTLNPYGRRQCEDLVFTRGAALHRALDRGRAKRARRYVTLLLRETARQEKMSRDSAAYRARARR